MLGAEQPASLTPPEGRIPERMVGRPVPTLAAGMNRLARFILGDDRAGASPALHREDAAGSERRPSSAGTTMDPEPRNERTDVP